jgi:hypothetical protein
MRCVLNLIIVSIEIANVVKRDYTSQYSKIPRDKLLNGVGMQTRSRWICTRPLRQLFVIVIPVRIEYSRLAFVFATFRHKRDGCFGDAANSCLLMGKHPVLFGMCICCLVSCFLVAPWNARGWCWLGPDRVCNSFATLDVDSDTIHGEYDPGVVVFIGERNTTLSIRTKEYLFALVFLVAICGRGIPVFYLEDSTWILTVVIKVENDGFTLGGRMLRFSC